MANEVDSLEIKVEAQAKNVNSQLDILIHKLSSVNSQLKTFDSSALPSLARGVSELGSAMASLQSIKATDFNRLARGINTLSDVRPARLDYAATAINDFVTTLNGLQNVSSSAMAVGELASNISKLGYKTVERAIVNIPQLSTVLKQMMETLSTAPAVSNNIIRMTNAMASLATNSKKVNLSTKNLSTGFKQVTLSTDVAKKGVKSLAYYFGKLYANYFLLIRAFKGIGEAIKSSMDYIEEYNYFNVTTGKIASEWKDQYKEFGYDNAEAYGNSFRTRLTDLMGKMSGYQINDDGTLTDKQLKNLGLDITELTNYSAGLLQVTNSLGLTGEASATTSKALTMLAGDMSSFRNTDLKTVMTNFQSGLIGQSRALYKYGIDITNATLQTYAYKNGITKAVSEMTQAEKMQLRMIAILDQSKTAWGDLSNTISSPSNQLRMLQNNIKALSRTIGQVFLPVVAQILPYVNGLVLAVRRLFDWIASLLGVDLSGIIDNSGTGYSDVFEGLADEADEASTSIDGAKNSAKALKNELMGFDEINKLSDITSSSTALSGGVGTPIDLTSQLTDALADYEKVWNESFARMSNASSKYADTIYKAMEPVKKLLSDIMAGNWYEAGQDVNEMATKTLKFIREVIKKVDWNQVGTDVGNFLRGLDWMTILVEVLKLKLDITQAIIEAWTATFKAAPIETTLLTLFAGLKFTGIWKVIAGNFGKSIKEGIFASTLVTSIIGAFKSFGGIGGILTMDTATVIGAGTLVEIGIYAASSIVSGIAAAIGGWTIGQWIYERLNDEILEMSFGEQMAYLWNSILEGDFLTGLKMTISDIIDSIFNWDQTFDLFGYAGESFQDVADAFKEKDWGRIGKDIVEGIGLGIVGALSFLFEPINDLFATIAEGIKKVFGIHSPARTMIPLGNYIVEGIGEGIQNGLSYLSSCVSDIFDTVWNGIGNFWSSAYDWGTDLMSGLTSGIRSGVAKVRNAVSDVAETIWSWLHFSVPEVGPLTTFESWMPDFMKGMASGIANNKYKVVDEIKSLANDLDISPKYSYAVPNNANIASISTINASKVNATNGIEQSIGTAVYSALMSSNTQNEQKQNPVFNVYVGGERLTDVVIKDVNGRTMATGVCPIVM